MGVGFFAVVTGTTLNSGYCEAKLPASVLLVIEASALPEITSCQSRAGSSTLRIVALGKSAAARCS